MDITKAVTLAAPGRPFVCNPETYEGLTMLDAGDKPSLAELQAVWDAYVTVRDADLNEGVATKAQIIAAYSAMKAGTGTTAERAARMEKAICYIAKHILHIVD